MGVRLFSLSVFLVLLAGCAGDPYVWRHPTKTGRDLAVEKEQCETTAVAEYPPKEKRVALIPGHITRCYALGDGARDCRSDYDSYYLPSPIYLGDGNVTPYLYPYPPMSSYRPPLYEAPSYTTNGNVEVYHTPAQYQTVDGNLDKRESGIKKCLRTKGWQLERVEEE